MEPASSAKGTASLLAMNKAGRGHAGSSPLGLWAVEGCMQTRPVGPHQSVCALDQEEPRASPVCAAVVPVSMAGDQASAVVREERSLLDP